MKIFTLLFTILLCTQLVIAQTETFTSSLYSFSASFSEKPIENTSSVNTEIGIIKVHSFIVEKSISSVFMISVSDYPADKVVESETKTYLKGAIKGFTDNLSMQVVHQEDITQNGYKGVYFEATSKMYKSQAKIILAKNRLYQVVVLANEISKQESKEFLDSFKILK